MLGEYSAYCGNPTPSAMDKPRQHPGQRPLPGQVVNGRYLPLSAAALDRSSSGPRQSRALGPPGGRGRERSLKGWARGRRGVNNSEKDIGYSWLSEAPPLPLRERNGDSTPVTRTVTSHAIVPEQEMCLYTRPAHPTREEEPASIPPVGPTKEPSPRACLYGWGGTTRSRKIKLDDITRYYGSRGSSHRQPD